MLIALLSRWLMLGWIGRLLSLSAALFALAWIVGNLGLTVLARQLGSVALLVASVLLTALCIRQIWRDHTGPRYR